MVEYKDTHETIKIIKHANQKRSAKKKKQVLPVPHQTVTFPPVHIQQKSKEDLLHIQHFII